MNPNKKLTLAKIELHLLTLLEKTNKEFIDKKEKYPGPNKKPISFQACSRNYQKIMELIDYNRKKNNTDDVLEFYYLEAWLGKVQSDLNDLPQYPSKKADLIDNNKEIEKIKKSVTDIEEKAKTLNLHNKKGINAALKKDFEDLLKRINEYADSLDKDTSERKAIYYYYYAENIIKKATSISDNDLKIKYYKHAIHYLNKSISLYKKAENFKHAAETLDYQKKVEKEQKNLEKFLTPTSKIKKISSSTEKPHINFSKVHEGLLSVAPKNQTKSNHDTRAVSDLPPKKRKIWEISNEEEPAPASKKANIASGEINITTGPLLQSEEETVQQKEAELKKMLAQTVINEDPFRFYGRLFFNLSEKLLVYSKESSNHTLLTQLSWLTVAKQLMDLIFSKNPTDNAVIKVIFFHINCVTNQNKKNLAIIRSQKRAEAYPIYNLLELKDKNLQNLLIEEIFDYYYGLEAFNLIYDAKNFLASIPHIIEKKHNFPCSFREIDYIIQPAYKLKENLFCATLLCYLVRFHIYNKDWRHDIFSSTFTVELYTEYLRILTISQDFSAGSCAEGQALRDKIQQLKKYLPYLGNTNPSNSFFQRNKQLEPLSIPLLNKILQEHFQCLLKYKISNISPEIIYMHLLGFIQTHCKEQIEMNHSRTSQLQTMRP